MYFYTQEEEKWLKNNVDAFVNSIGLTKAFNKKFCSNRKNTAIRKKVSYLLPGHKYGHSGGQKRGFGTSVTAMPIGSEILKDGYIFVKVADNPLPKNYTSKQRNKNWKAKHRLVWEKAHGEIPKDHLVVFLDGDKTNFDLNNLYLISRKITTPMIRNGWFSKDRDLTLAAIKWCELHYTLK